MTSSNICLNVLDFLLCNCMKSRTVFLNCRAVARYRALASIIPGHDNLSF